MFNMQIDLQTRRAIVRTLVYFIMVCTLMMVSALIVAPVMAQEPTDELIIVTATEPAGTEEATATQEVVIVPLEDFEQIAVDQLDNTIVKIIQSNDLKTTAMFIAFAVFAGGALFLVFRSSPPDKQLAFVEELEPRLEKWRDAMRQQQEAAQETDSPYDDILRGGGVALLNEVIKLRQTLEDQLRQQQTSPTLTMNATGAIPREAAEVIEQAIRRQRGYSRPTQTMSVSQSELARVPTEGVPVVDDEDDKPHG
jgi:hypothetical protein